jgi:hypothetical protein
MEIWKRSELEFIDERATGLCKGNDKFKSIKYKESYSRNGVAHGSSNHINKHSFFT